MNEEVEVEINGKIYHADYSTFGDTLVTYLPDGSTKEVELKGLKPQAMARTHLQNYVSKLNT